MRLIIMCFILSIMYYSGNAENHLLLHQKIVAKIYEGRESWRTSKLGAMLFKQHPNPRTKTHTILFWNYKKSQHSRHNFYFGSKQNNPLEGCSVNNCVFTKDNSKVSTADAVVVDLNSGQSPPIAYRNPAQRWIFLFDDSPKNAFGSGFTTRKDYTLLNNIFNWSMTYASEADIPVPYGRMVPLANPRYVYNNVTIDKLVPYWNDKQNEALVAILSFHCVPYRTELVARLRKFINVDDYGRCGEGRFKPSCSVRHKTDCKALSKYLFYLAFENSKCKEYMTETLFYNAYFRGAIPIIQGPSRIDCEKLLPPHSYLHVDNYDTMEDLVEDILRITNDKTTFFEYHWWRNHFEIVNEHGYFGTRPVHQCRVCEALNYNDERKSVYSSADLTRFLNEKTLCTTL